MSDIKITSKNIEEFKEIQDTVNKLHKDVLSQIESAEKSLLGFECVIKRHLYNKRIILPKTTTQITQFGDFIGIYCGEYFFKINNGSTNYKIDFVFI